MPETIPVDWIIKCQGCGFVGFITDYSVDYEHEVIEGMDIRTFQVIICPKCGEKLNL